MLPMRVPRQEKIGFLEAEGSRSGDVQQLSDGRHNWRVIRELDRDYSTLEVINDNGAYRLEDINLIAERKAEEWYSYQGDNFQSARGETVWHRRFKRSDWEVRTATRTVLRCDASSFFLDAELDAYEGERRVYSQDWNRRIKRRLV